jgi:hypothetical protein
LINGTFLDEIDDSTNISPTERLWISSLKKKTFQKKSHYLYHVRIFGPSSGPNSKEHHLPPPVATLVTTAPCLKASTTKTTFFLN